jgi:hypothetical protein
MKKVSTAAAKQIRNFSEQKLTIGRPGIACWTALGVADIT